MSGGTPDVGLSEAEVEQIDDFMDQHMHGHAISNSPHHFSCDVHCRRNALRLAVEAILAARAHPGQADRALAEVERRLDEVFDASERDSGDARFAYRIVREVRAKVAGGDDPALAATTRAPSIGTEPYRGKG